MALSGSDLAYKQARSGIARAGASRAGFYTPNVVLTIDGVDRSGSILLNSLDVHLARNDEPSTARFTLEPTTTIPLVGEHVVVGLGTAVNAEFAGQVIRSTRRREPGLFDAPFIDVECVDWRRLFDRQRVTNVWVDESATTIAEAIVDEWTDGFTHDGIQQGLPTIDQFVADNETPSALLRRLVTLIGGGGFLIRPDRDVRLFDTNGDAFSDALTNPLTITNSPAPLAFSATFDGSQQRTQVVVLGKATELLITVPAGQGGVGSAFETYGIPVKDAVAFESGSGQALLGRDVVITYGTVSRPGTIGNIPAQATNAIANIGDTTVSLPGGGESGFVTDDARWFTADGLNYFTGICNSGGASQIESIPATGYGSIRAAIPSGSMVYMVHALYGCSIQSGQDAIPDDLVPGTSVRVYYQANAIVEQALLGGVEGGSGIHSHVIDEPDLDLLGAQGLALAELEAFADADGVFEAEWETLDLNARPGTQQAISITGTDPISTTVTITSVDLSFPLANYRPKRRCRGSNVKPAELLDILADRT